jgi:hypothetical protein
MNLFNLEYNILKIAGSTLGHIHYTETLLKQINRKFAVEALAKIRKAIILIISEILSNYNLL